MAGDAGKLHQKVIDVVAAFEVVKQRFHGDSRSSKARRAAEDFGVYGDYAFHIAVDSITSELFGHVFRKARRSLHVVGILEWPRRRPSPSPGVSGEGKNSGEVQLI